MHPDACTLPLHLPLRLAISTRFSRCTHYPSSFHSLSDTGVLCPPQARNEYQRFTLGALSILLVDKEHRAPYLEAEPNFATLLTLCESLEG